jgi:hypothetical protein
MSTLSIPVVDFTIATSPCLEQINLPLFIIIFEKNMKINKVITLHDIINIISPGFEFGLFH